MENTRLSNADIVTLLEGARDDWQAAAELATRDLWYASGGRQAAAQQAMERVIEELTERGL